MQIGKLLSGLAFGIVTAAALAAKTAAAPAQPTTLRALYGLSAPKALVRPKTALVLVDFQDEFFHGRLPLPGAQRAAEHAGQLLAWARAQGISVVHVQNVSARPNSLLFAAGSPGSAIVAELSPRPGELTIQKSLLGAFSRTSLDAELRARGVDTLIVTGLMTHLAVQVTATDATLLGYHAVVAADAVATRALPGAGGLPGVDAPTLQRATLAALADRSADVLTSLEITRLPLAAAEPAPAAH